jgi:hypothetical protein
LLLLPPPDFDPPPLLELLPLFFDPLLDPPLELLPDLLLLLLSFLLVGITSVLLSYLPNRDPNWPQRNYSTQKRTKLFPGIH